MIRRAGAPESGDPAGPVPDVGKQEEEEEEEGGMGPCLPVTPKNCLPRRGISVLEKLIKTCPVWLQLGLGRVEAARILQREAAGTFLVCRDSSLKHLVLCVHFPSLNDSSSEVLEYTIKEEKSILYLEGSVLVFEDIFRLIAFYCVSRDLLPFTLKLPQAILEAHSFTDLETISNLGLGFWDSSLNPRRGGGSPAEPPRDPAPGAPPASSLKSSAHYENCSCEIELSVGNDRLWFVNPIFIEDCGGGALPADQPPPESCPSRPLPPTSKWAPRRPAPPPPAPPLHPAGPLQPPPGPAPAPALACPLPASPPVAAPPPPEPLPPTPPASVPHPAPHAPGPPDPPSQPPMAACERSPRPPTGLGPLREEEVKPGLPPSPLPQTPAPPTPVKKNLPAAPPRRRISEKVSLEDQSAGKADRGMAAEGDQLGLCRASTLSLPPRGTSDSPGERPPRTKEQGQEAVAKASDPGSMPEPPRKIRQPPVPPPRRRRISQQLASGLASPSESTEPPTKEEAREKPTPGPSRGGQSPDPQTRTQSPHAQTGARPQSSPEFKGSLASLADSLGVPASATDQDSYSTSSTEEELEHFGSSGGKKKPSAVLGKARHRLSFASFTNVFHAFLSNNRKLYKKVVELAQDKASYFGNLVQDYKVYSLEMMARQTSSTEMLQEIRTMMTQLKSYLLQSTELKALVDPTLHSEEELEAIVESALYKCVLKPLKEAINSCLREIHSKDGSLQQLRENQLVILATTTTDLGVTTSVPEVPIMEKILQKFTSMYKAYSPEKKISILLKTCKLIYDSMALGNPGKPYGADDFLPVLMYVLARSNLTEMLLNVEYMMELMDPALQLGEGSYYLTTTYGALEHIKNYDKITVTRQLSMEVQDSIHRWERRRTLNKARALALLRAGLHLCVVPGARAAVADAGVADRHAGRGAVRSVRGEIRGAAAPGLPALRAGRRALLPAGGRGAAPPHQGLPAAQRAQARLPLRVPTPGWRRGRRGPALPRGAGAQLPLRPGLPTPPPPAPPVAAFKAWLAWKRADWAPACSPSPQHVHTGAPHLNTRTLPTWMGCPPGTLICNIPSMRRPTQQNSCEDPVRSARGAKFFIRRKGRLRLRERRDSPASCGKQSPSLPPVHSQPFRPVLLLQPRPAQSCLLWEGLTFPRTVLRRSGLATAAHRAPRTELDVLAPPSISGVFLRVCVETSPPIPTPPTPTGDCPQLLVPAVALPPPRF